MKSALIGIALCCFSCLATTRMSAQPDIKGRVVDLDTGEGLEGVEVTLYADAYWTDTKITSPQGDFFFEFNQKISPGSTLYFSFCKAGYEVVRGPRKLPIGEIKLKRAPVGIIQVTDLIEGRFLPNIGIRMVSSPASSRGVRTDEWGIAAIQIPASFKDGDTLEFSINGNDLYRNINIKQPVKTLRTQIQQVRLQPANPSFDLLIKRYDRSLSQYRDQLNTHNSLEIHKSRNDLKRIREAIKSLRNLKPEEQQKWAKYEEALKDIFEYFNFIENDGVALKINASQHNDSVKLFDRTFSILLKEKSAKRAFQLYDQEFYLGMNILNYEAGYLKKYKDARPFGKHADKMVNLLEQEDALLERYKDKLAKTFYQNRKTLILSQARDLETMIKKPINITKS